MTQDQLTSLEYHGRLQVRPDASGQDCGFLLVSSDAYASIDHVISLPQWALLKQVWQVNKRSEVIYIYQRIGS